MPILEISPHLTKVYRSFDVDDWKTSASIAAAVEISPRTARKHLLALTEAGVLEQKDLFPGYRFRLIPKPSPAARKLIGEIEAAAEVFGEE